MNSLKVNACEMSKYFSNCDLSQESTEGRLIAVNDKFLAYSWKNGEIIIADSSNPSNIKNDIPHIKGNGKIFDLEFSPFYNNILSSCYSYNSNNFVSIWKIPENGIKENLAQEFIKYKDHTKKICFINFNPVIEDLICSGAITGEIHAWNWKTGKNCASLKADDTPTFVSWNPNGSLIGVSTKKRNINIFDLRQKNMIHNQIINETMNNSKFVWINNQGLANIDWTKNKTKELKLWDIRKLDKNYSAKK